MTKWMKEAWDVVDPAIIKRGFKKCCLTNPTGENDGIEMPADDDFNETDVRNDAVYDDRDLITDNQMGQMFLAESDRLRLLFRCIPYCYMIKTQYDIKGNNFPVQGSASTACFPGR